jgi:RecB family exonuclease
MAVLVRSPARDLPPIRRALTAAGVPCAAGAVDPAADDPVVRAILAVLRFGLEPQKLTGEQAVGLLTAPGIGLDTDAIRRLRRRLRTAHAVAGPTADLVAAAVLGAPLPDDLPADLREPVLTARSLLDLVGSVAAEPDPRVPLWLVWQRLGLADDLLAASLRGGRAGLRADRSLDAVLALFDLAGELAERLPYAGVRAFLDQAVDRRIAVDPASGDGRAPQGVALLSAHGSKGLEWDVVCLAGVSEGRWPLLRRPHSLLGLDELLDAADGIAGGADTGGGPSESLQEERRLLYVAATRARRRLVATSVSDQDTVPSRFLPELAGSADLPHGWPARPDGRLRRSLQVAHLVADLRRTITDPSTPAPVADLAARQLARLATAGVDGAHPRDWYGLAGPSTTEPPVAPQAPVTLSPSAVESVLRCPLRAVLERRGARSATSQQQIEGVVMHALVDGLARGVSRPDLEAEMERFLAQPTGLPPWLIARTRRALQAMLTAAQTWIADLPAERRPMATEASLSAWLPRAAAPPRAVDRIVDPVIVPADPETVPDHSAAPSRPVRVKGRADRIDRAPDGSLIIVDFKTGATVPSRATVEQNAQLAVYQLALHLGAGRTLTDDDPEPGPPGGAELVYLRSGTPTVRHQSALDDDAANAWMQELRHAAEFLAAPASGAVENRSCERCPVRSSCPLQPSGRQVTR